MTARRDKDALYEAFLTKFTAAMAAAPVGDPLVEQTVLGPLSSVAAATRLQDQVDRAVAQGATWSPAAPGTVPTIRRPC